MWNIEFKSSKDTQEWFILDSYDNKTSACFRAYQVAADYFKVKVRDADGSVLWSN